MTAWLVYWALVFTIVLNVNRWQTWLRLDRATVGYLVGALTGGSIVAGRQPWSWLVIWTAVAITQSIWCGLEREKAQYAGIQNPSLRWRLRHRCGRVIQVSHYMLQDRTVHLPHTCTRWRFHPGQHREAHGSSLRQAKASLVTR